MAPIAKAAKSLNKSTPPRTFEFSVGHPTGLTALDVDLIKVSGRVSALVEYCFEEVLAALRVQYQVQMRDVQAIGRRRHHAEKWLLVSLVG